MIFYFIKLERKPRFRMGSPIKITKILENRKSSLSAIKNKLYELKSKLKIMTSELNS